MDEKDKRIRQLAAINDRLKAEVDRLKQNLRSMDDRSRLDQKDIDHLWDSRRDEMAKLTAEVERLKAAPEAEVDLVYDGLSASSRAWKRCALRMRQTMTLRHYNNSLIEYRQFVAYNKHGHMIVITKAPPDWREKWR